MLFLELHVLLFDSEETGVCGLSVNAENQWELIHIQSAKQGQHKRAHAIMEGRQLPEPPSC